MTCVTPTIGHVLHRLDRAGAEVLAGGLSRGLGDRYRFVFLCLDGLGALGEQLRAEGFIVEELGRRPGLDFAVARRLRRAVRRHQIDLLHAHQYTPFFYSAWSRRWHGSPPILFTEHGRHYPDPRKLKRLMMNRLLFQRQDRATAVGAFIRRALIANEGLSGDRIEVIHNGVAMSPLATMAQRRAARVELGLDPHDRVIMQVARFHPVKDHETALRAFAIVAERIARARLVLIGDGAERPACQRLAGELGVADRVMFTGVRADVSAMLAGADLFMLSSLSEGISVTLLEAMAAGLAICATDVGGNGEVVEDPRTGLLSPRRAPGELAENLSALLTDPHRRAAMGAMGRARAEALFNESRMHQRYAGLYDGMLGRC